MHVLAFAGPLSFAQGEAILTYFGSDRFRRLDNTLLPKHLTPHLFAQTRTLGFPDGPSFCIHGLLDLITTYDGAGFVFTRPNDSTGPLWMRHACLQAPGFVYEGPAVLRNSLPHTLEIPTSITATAFARTILAYQPGPLTVSAHDHMIQLHQWRQTLQQDALSSPLEGFAP